MSSTYLDLTNRVLRRLNEVELTASTFPSAIGIHAVAKDAVLDTVRRINAEKYAWPFNTVSATQALTANTNEYAWPTGFSTADWESFYIYKDGTIATTTRKLKSISYKEWYDRYRENDYDSTAGVTEPYFVFDIGNGSLGVSPVPNAAYTLKYRYFLNTVTLSAYTDICSIPTEYDYVIVDGASMYMYAFLDNTPRSQLMEQSFKMGLNRMEYLLIPKAPSMRDTRIPSVINAG